MRLVATALLFAGSVATATPLTLRVTAAPGANLGTDARFVLRRLSETAAIDPSVKAIEHPVKLGESSIDIPSGTWRIDVDAPGIWQQPLIVNVPATSTFDIRLWREAKVKGEVVLESKSAVPERLGARFSTAEGLSGEVICSVETTGHFSCALPATTADLALRIPGHITRYFWSASLTSGTRDLGPIEFKRGAMITGRVELPRGSKVDLQTITIGAAPAHIEASPGRELISLSTRATEKGFFHLDGIAPGDYRIRAATRGNTLSAPPTEVRVIEGMEANLSRPLTLSAPHPVSINVTPPLNPEMSRWHVELLREMSPSDYESAAIGLADQRGVVRFDAIHTGRYQLHIGPQSGDIWHSSIVDIEPGTANMFIPLSLCHVRGNVLLGDKPLAAKIWFGGEDATVSIQMQSDDSGAFSGYLPRIDRPWPVTVQSDAPKAKRNFAAVRLKERNDGDFETELRMEMTLLQGDVVDEEGAAVPRAMLNITSFQGGLLQPNAEADGRFAVYGLEPGRYSVTASSYMRESRVVEVEVSKEAESPSIRLVVLPTRELRGLVRSPYGPVPGAGVMAVATDFPPVLTSMVETDERGKFSAVIPPGAEQLDVIVQSGGFALKIFHVRWERRELVIPVNQSGGTLTVMGIAPRNAILIHNRAAVRFARITGLMSMTASERTTIPMIEAGTYTVCDASDRGRCASGYLPPFGTLTLDLNGKSSGATPHGQSRPIVQSEP